MYCLHTTSMAQELRHLMHAVTPRFEHDRLDRRAQAVEQRLRTVPQPGGSAIMRVCTRHPRLKGCTACPGLTMTLP